MPKSPKIPRTGKRRGRRDLEDALFGLAADFVTLMAARLGGMRPDRIPPPMFRCEKCGAAFWTRLQTCPVCGKRQETAEPLAKPRMNRMQAAIFVASASGMPKDYILESKQRREHAYKVAAKRLHPDKPGGSHEQFCKLQEAMEVLG